MPAAIAYLLASRIAVLTVAAAALLPTALSAECSSPDGPAAVVATYDGGQVTVADICQALSDKDFMAFVGSTAQTPVIEIGDAARKLASTRLLVQYAKDNGLDKTPEFRLESRFLAEKVLAAMVREELRIPSDQLAVTEDQIAAYYTSSKDKFRPGLKLEDVRDEIARQIRYEDWQARLTPVQAKADAAFPIRCGSEVIVETASPADGKAVEKPMVQCGKFGLTKDELATLGSQSGASLSQCKDIREYLQRGSLDRDLALAQLARTEGYDKKPLFASRVKLASDGVLGQMAREALVAKWLAETKYEEAQLKQAYDEEWTATVDPQLEYDVILFPATVAEGATDATRRARLIEAEGKARRTITAIQAGASFEDAEAAASGAQIIRSQRRLLNESDELYSAVSGLAPGQVVPDPIHDMGGMCVIRVKSFDQRKKTPYEMAKRYVEEGLKRKVEQDLRENFEDHLLGRSGFSLDSKAVERIVR